MPSALSEPSAIPSDGASLHRSRRGGRPGRAWLSTWVAAIAVLLTIAGVAAWGLSTSVTTAAPLPPPGWLTFYQAAPVAGQVIDSLVVGPWALTFATGVAADAPWAPTIGGTFGSTAACAARLSGLSLYTYWNDTSYPVSHASNVFSSGAAPVWTFGYRDAAGDTALASVVNGTGIYNGVWTAGSGCAAPIEPEYRTGFNVTSVVDSSRIAATVMGLPAGFVASQGGANAVFDPANPGPAFEMY